MAAATAAASAELDEWEDLKLVDWLWLPPLTIAPPPPPFMIPWLTAELLVAQDTEEVAMLVPLPVLLLPEVLPPL